MIRGWDSKAPRRGLSAGTRRRARAVAEGMFADEHGPPPSERLDWLERDLDDFLGHVSSRGRWIFSLSIAALYYVAPLLLGRLRTLGGLDAGDRVRAIEAFDRSPFALALLGAKAILSIIYFEHPDAAREIGWDQECLKP